MFSQQQNNQNIINIILIIISIYFLYPLLQSGYVSDDAYNSMIRGSILEKETSFFKYVLDLNWGWLSNSGRLYPIEHFSQTFIFYFIKNLFLFKCLKLLLILFSIYYFRLNIIEFTNSKLLGNICILFLIVFFQFRQWHDPILGFAILIPLVCFFLFSSLYYYQAYLRINKKNYLYKSILLYICLLLTYEISYPLIILFIVIYYFKSNSFNNISSTLKYHFIIFLLVILITIYFRLNVGEKSYPSLDQSFSILEFLKALGVQIFSGLSFSYYPKLKINYFNNLQLSDFLIFIYFGILFFQLKKIQYSNFKLNLIIKLLILGFLLIITQSFMVAISGHKNDLINMGLGFGYLPVLIEYFGYSIAYLSIILFIFLKVKNEFLKNFLCIFLCLCFSLNGLLNISNNRYVVHESNKFYKYPRELLKKALSDYSDESFKDAKIIIRNWRYPHDINWFYSKHTNKLFCIIDFNKNIDAKDFSWPSGCAKKKFELNGKTLELKDSDLVYSLSYNFDPDGNNRGIVYFAKVDEITLNENGKISSLMFKNLSIFDENINSFNTIELENFENFVEIIKQDKKLPNEIDLPFL